MKGLVSHLSRVVLGLILVGWVCLSMVELYECLSSEGLLQSFQSPIRIIFAFVGRASIMSLTYFVSLFISSIFVLFAGK